MKQREQSWFLDNAKPALRRGKVWRDGEGWQGALAMVSNINQVPPGMGCGDVVHRHRSGEQPLRHCSVLVSVFTRAPAACPALNLLLALANPSFGQVLRKTRFQHLSLWGPRRV